MQTKSIIYCFIALLFFSCSSEEDSSPIEPAGEENGNLNESNILISLVENAIVSSEEISITISKDVDISSLEVFLDNELVKRFTAPPYSFTLDAESYSDGNHSLKVEVYSNQVKTASRTINIKTDNNGPLLALDGIANDEIICSEITVEPQITDIVSDIKHVEVFLDDIPIFETNGSDFTFHLNPTDFTLGHKNLKFVMEDVIGNISMDSVRVGIAKKIIGISFPDDFVRVNTDKVHAILSDAEGNFLDRVTHSSGKAETLEFCSLQEFEDHTEFILTFVEDFQDVIFGFYVYGNLTKAVLGDQITFSSRAGGLSSASVNLDIPSYEDGFYVRSSSVWSSMIYTNDAFSGHFSTSFTKEDLGIDKAFVQYFHPDLGRSYQWAFVEDIHTKFSLEASDFTSADVIHSFLSVNGSNLDPFLSIHGFDNETRYNAMSGHLIYWNPSLNRINGYDYSYADIFDHIVYSARVSNYAVQGAGAPPASITVPGTTIDYGFMNNQLTFSGLP
ncbi:MAG: Ig-like domain-containing protein, partial [Bacteroidota bacterium]